MSLILTPRQFQQQSELYHQLGQMTTAGIGLIQALEMQQRNPPARSFRRPLAEILSHLNQGATFGQALGNQSPWMPRFDVALITAGETSGRLPAMFRLLAGYYEDRARLLRTTLGLLLYPLFIFHFAVLIFPVTRLQGFILRGEWLPFLGQKLLVLAPLYLAVLLGVVAMQSRRSEWWRASIERLLQAVPVLGAARRSLALARLCAALEALLSAGVPIIEAWKMAASASGSPLLARAVHAAVPRMEVGETPAEMVNASSEFPQSFANLYQTGEVSGQLEDTLKRLNQYHQEEGSRKLKLFLLGAGGLLVGAIMIGVAWQIIAFWLGHFQQIQQAIPE